MFKQLFALRGELKGRTLTILEISGLFLILLIWFLISAGANPLVSNGILPKPIDVYHSFGTLFSENELLKNICRSLGYNIAGYLEAILIAIPVGFLLGLIPFVRGLFRQSVDALRYVPLPAAIGLFISLFGLGTGLKVHFLAFGIVIYLIPVVIQRINDVEDVYLKTVYTLGANWWQTLSTVYIPAVISRLSDDIRVLTAISWTYIIIAESIGGEGGIGALIWRIGQRQGRMDVVYALLIIIILIGIIQDKLFMRMDKEFFPYKYATKENKVGKEGTILGMIGKFVWEILVWVILVGYVLLLVNEYMGIFSNTKVLSYLFGGTTFVINILIISILAYKIFYIINKFRK